MNWVEDEEGLEGFMSTNNEETSWLFEENDAFIAGLVSGRNFKFKKRKGKGKSTSKKGSHQRGGFKPFRKGSSGGKANMANEYQDPYDQAYWEKAKERRQRKEIRIPMSLKSPQLLDIDHEQSSVFGHRPRQSAQRVSFSHHRAALRD